MSSKSVYITKTPKKKKKIEILKNEHHPSSIIQYKNKVFKSLKKIKIEKIRKKE
jgi:hypothetical protein